MTLPSSKFNWDVDTWKVLDGYFSQESILVNHQLDSFNNLIDFLIPQVIERNNPIVIATDHDSTDFRKVLTIEFGQTYLSKPLIHENNDSIKPMLPNEARLRGLTYASPMFIDVKYTFNTTEGIKKEVIRGELLKVPFMKMPIMLRSKYCHLNDHSESSLAEMGECEYDQGGYFIVNGNEKVLVSQERQAENQVFVWPKNSNSKFSHEAEIKTSIDQRFFPIKSNKVLLSKEPSIRSRSQSTNKGCVSGRCLYVKMPYINEPIPLFIMFRALGILTEKEIFEMIMPDWETIGSNYTNFLIPSVDEARREKIENSEIDGITTQELALRYLADSLNVTFSSSFKVANKDCQLKYVKDVLMRELFPHIGQIGPNIGQTFRKKAFFLGYMTRKLINCFFGVCPYDDRDHYGNKRVDLSGPLLNTLFKTHFIKLIKDLRTRMIPLINDPQSHSKLQQSLRDLIKGCNIDSKIKYGLSTGNWNTQKSSLSSTKKGIAQVLNRLSFMGALSHTRRIQSPLERSGSKIVPPRRLHGTHYGMCCPNETPEGQQVGIVKNLAMQTHVTIHTSDYPIRIILNKLGVTDLIETVAKDVKCCTKIFVNGEWFGCIREEETHKLYERLRILKRHGVIVPYVSIVWSIDWKEIRIQTDGGRYSRPLYVVENGKLLIEEQFNTNDTFRENLLKGKLKWHELLMGYKIDAKMARIDNGGVIEYLDTNEIETMMIAMTRNDMSINQSARLSDNKSSYYVNYTHCEIHPMMMMGVVASMIPFSDHNQSPRNCYQCLWKEETVVMGDGSRKKIGDIKVGDVVITVDPNTLEYKLSSVINQYVKTTKKKIINLKLMSGRQLICTQDHPILTYNGWMNADQLNKQSLVCVCPIKEFYPLDKNDLIINGDQFRVKMKETNMNSDLIEHQYQQLTNLGLLPLYQNNQKIQIISRIVGLCMTHGTINGSELIISLSNWESVEQYLNDLSQLGIDEHTISGLCVVQKSALVSLIMSLDVPFVTHSSSLPTWIKNGSNSIIREFLSGFQVDFGGQIIVNKSNIILRNTSISKYSIQLMTEVRQLFIQMGIECDALLIKDNNMIHIPFSCSNHNIINYFERIGYTYNLREYNHSLPIYEYLKYQQSCNNLDDCISIENWFSCVKVVKNSIFVPIDKINNHENVEISDITTESSNHSFITGSQICVHNSSMAKQSIGYYVTNYNSRMDTMAHVLVYGHKPLVVTRCAKYVIMDKLPHGTTAMLLYACYTGYNQEDSIVVNGDAVERGFFNTLFYRTYVDKAQKHKTVTTATEKFAKPDINKNPSREIKVTGTYDAINSEGEPIVNKKIHPGDVIIGKVMELKEKDIITYKDVSTITRINEGGTIDKVIPEPSGKILPYNAEGHRIIKARVVNLRKPRIGDKFASRYSQKGTCGILYKSIDMPFTCNGLVPDIIMNPHGIPSRMTVGKLLETLLGKAACCTGQVQDATPFHSYDFEGFKQTLASYGMNELGNEIMYNGQTGKMFEVKFFYGPTYYQRLKHMVEDKVHSRESGKVQLLTRQPAEGRSRDGGLRLGEMERDCFIAHGIPKFLKERMMDSSDLFKVFVSKKEEAIVVGNSETNTYKFNGQHIKDDEVYQVQLPYAMKLLLQELESMGIDIRLQLA